MTELRPREGDRVSYREPTYGTSGHTGVVLDRRGRRLRLEVFGQDRARLVDLELIEGWWPKDAKDRSPQALRPVEA